MPRWASMFLPSRIMNPAPEALRAILAAPSLRRVFAALAPHGGALVVGGAVRDTLMGLVPHDVDLATAIPLEAVAAALEAEGIRILPTGLAHGVLTAVSEGDTYEIARFRRDVACDGRRAVTSWSAEAGEDAQRRDFTVNALYATPEGHLVDHVGGREDLTARRIRFVGEPSRRIREDRLRALRFFRFWARFGDPDPAVHAEAMTAVAGFARDLSILSRERIGWEIVSLLSVSEIRPQTACMAEQGYWDEILPGSRPQGLLDALDAEGPDAPAPCALSRLAALDAPGLQRALKLSTLQARQVEAMRDAAVQADPAVAAWTLGARAAEGGILLRLARGAPVAPDWRDRIAHGAGAEFPVKAADFPELEGATLGQALRSARMRWLEAGLPARTPGPVEDGPGMEPA